MLETRFANCRRLPCWAALAARLLVNHSFAAPGVNTKMVNRSAAELFPVSVMLKEPFIPAQKRSAALSA
jgi:hypothetical protein